MKDRKYLLNTFGAFLMWTQSQFIDSRLNKMQSIWFECNWCSTTRWAQWWPLKFGSLGENSFRSRKYSVSVLYTKKINNASDMLLFCECERELCVRDIQYTILIAFVRLYSQWKIGNFHVDKIGQFNCKNQVYMQAYEVWYGVTHCTIATS